MDMASSDVHKCVAMYDGKLQKLAKQAEGFVNACTKDEKDSRSTDGLSQVNNREPVEKTRLVMLQRLARRGNKDHKQK